MQVSDEPVYQSKQNRSKNANTRRSYSAGQAQVNGLYGVRLGRVRTASYRHISVGRDDRADRDSERSALQMVMTTLPRAWPFSRYRMASAAWLSG